MIDVPGGSPQRGRDEIHENDPGKDEEGMEKPLRFHPFPVNKGISGHTWPPPVDWGNPAD